ncbi:hypothetical protein EJB05_36756 [Eragrostis curvula]|uniref:Uncharacterized protein n=1 Tax=Eragrostis curvula TaxID=38414 RepID=A0A5J9UAA6_9POAL|nr:hypothetical protein EJB05_36756 [Eragrostis curvula]
MSFRISGHDLASLRVERDDELFGTSVAAVSDGESDAGDEDHFPDGAGDQQGQQHRMFVPQPLRRMNSDSIYDMSSMTAQLPPKKKGLSRYYEGRSQSFACMSEVRSLEDLQKKDNPYKQKIKPCKSYAALGGGMPKANKASSNSCANLNIVATNGFMAHGIHVNENGYHQ